MESDPEGNRRLTALVGAVLLLLFAAQGMTILFLDTMLTWHFVIGLALIGPVALKMVVTAYRFVRYYTGAPVYRRQGPPPLLLRLLAPLLVSLTVAVLATGCALALGGRNAGGLPMVFLHKASFVCWAAAMSVHVLAHVWRLPRLVGAELPRRRPARHRAGVIRGRGGRWSLLLLSLSAGTVLALYGPALATHWTRESPQHAARPGPGAVGLGLFGPSGSASHQAL
ncbi:hypothetical protein ADK60_01175 [Streptomyces sp. XY431]|uniref:hypothetical protein n=1 Tax=Streptomyces sp. XY431 TaxID=1415562 RepID=UPI0006AF0E6B|nr:hypothetical protein [Streptomyces sp. XY431]KOV38995.1 hypothetical protein ADK60_01175 [Streptomyces sp. XY431]